MIRLIETVSDLRSWRQGLPGPVVLVPTMGALHQGHLALVREARTLAGPEGQVIVSIFVNPLQFGPDEDLESYPRSLQADLEGCESAGADAVFAPPVGEVYAPDRSIQISETRLSRLLCGASRPGHFDGVCTVVTKLFHLVQPTQAVFGKKDFQQLAIIRRLIRDLNLPVEARGVDTIREPDGLAMSSRNQYLTAEERQQAPTLHRALVTAHELWTQGEGDVAVLRGRIESTIQRGAPSGRIDYIEVVDAVTLERLQTVPTGGGGLIALAVHFGKARLIDNIELGSNELGSNELG